QRFFAETLKAAKQSMTERLQSSQIDLAEVKSQIESGSYEVDSNELADSILMLQGYYERR
ncbi:flagellar biosynthesis anti-sigma factor FlgM, partial [Christensenellaceae bacterium OttesenSCG-928-K19]|nr:flagellar biosynthesis anti-sigma factor FlgM [Christensenellaceae bacterium OttesenSCG-928-K19]